MRARGPQGPQGPSGLSKTLTGICAVSWKTNNGVITGNLDQLGQPLIIAFSGPVQLAFLTPPAGLAMSQSIRVLASFLPGQPSTPGLLAWGEVPLKITPIDLADPHDVTSAISVADGRDVQRCRTRQSAKALSVRRSTPARASCRCASRSTAT